jgi:hypothetical protein
MACLHAAVLAAVAAAALTPSASLRAQALAPDDQPVNLLPPSDPPPAVEGGALQPQGFEIEPLEEVDAAFLGPLTRANGGLDGGLWRGSSRGKIERLLQRLPLHRSPALASLSRRVLLTAGAAPSGAGTGVDVLALRARLLAEMGYLPDAIDLLRMAPTRALDAEAAALAVDLAWRGRDVESACNTLLQPPAPLPLDAERQQQRIFCQWRAGQAEDARFGMELLREMDAADEVFELLMERMAGNDAAAVPVPDKLTSPLLAMYREAREPLPEQAFTLASTDAVAALAMDAEADPALRLSAAEAAASQGALPLAVVREVYVAQSIDPQDLAGAAALPKSGASARDRAILYQAALAASAPEARVSILQVALGPTGRAETEGWRRQVFAPLLIELPPQPSLGWYAPEAAHHLFAIGQFERARAWIALTQGDQSLGGGTIDTNSAMMLPSLLALDYLAGGYESVPVLNSFIAQSQVNAGPDSVERLQAIFAAFDDSLAPVAGLADESLAFARSDVSPELPQDNINLWLDLGDAAAKGQTGETALLSLIGLRDLAAADPLWLRHALSSLRRVGLEDEARRIAVEAAIANGL